MARAYFACTDCAARGLPALTGSPKQVAWAETLRDFMVRDLDAEAASLLATLRADLGRTLGADHLALAELEPAIALLVEEYRRQAAAAWWIDRRGGPGREPLWAAHIRHALYERGPELAPALYAAVSATAATKRS